MDTEAVRKHDELAGLGRERNRNKTQHQLHWTKGHQTIVTHFQRQVLRWNRCYD
jgi:hypothetical protein